MRITSTLMAALALSMICLPPRAHGRAADGKLSMLWRPASTQPMIRLRGGSFSIQAVAPSTAKGWEAYLVPPHASWSLIKLKLSAAAYDSKSKRWKIAATIPATTPEELYGLQLSHAKASDTNKISVRVLTAYPKAYYVAHYTDTQNAAIVPGHTAKMKDIIKDLNLIQPEFAINTGDLVSFGNAQPQGNNEYKNFIKDLEKSRVTTFNIPGNHDIYHMRCWDRQKFQTQYERYIGERNYSFGFGKDHYTGVEISGYTWFCPHTKLTTAQQQWLKADFTAAVKAGRKPLVLFAHQVEYGLKMTSSNRHKLMTAHNVPLYLYGHIHYDKVETAGKLPTHYVATDNAGAGRFRLVDIASGKIISYGHGGKAKDSMPTGKVGLTWSQPNNGKSKDLTATFSSGLSQQLKYLKATFVMSPPGAAMSYKASGGTIHQVVHTAKGPTYVYVRGGQVKAKGKAKVRVWLAAGSDAGVADVGVADAGVGDVAAPDLASIDGPAADKAGKPDSANQGDGPTPDSAAKPDAPQPDAAAVDVTAPDISKTDAGATSDSAGADAGEPAPAEEGCSCAVGGSPAGGLWLLLLFFCWARSRRL